MTARHTRRWLVAVLGLGASAATGAGLEWKAHALQARTAPFQAAVELVFDFKNDTARPVTVRGVRTNCDCLDAATDHATYQPGQRGQLKARFTVGDRRGIYRRAITVETDEPGQSATQLTVSIEVPEVVALSQSMLDWRTGSARREKTVILRPVPGQQIELVGAEATNDDFAVTLKTIKRGEIYRLSVTPKSTARAANAAIRVSGHDQAGHTVLVSAYANVK
ncbi:MAG: DUF1573 domain-containing protein [Opitutae bacterium]|nr:DUF1573 domain-containing protein [Opitutae bacterium]